MGLVNAPDGLIDYIEGHFFLCPNCGRESVQVSIDRDLFRDILFVRAVCFPCDVYSSMEVSPYALTIINVNIFMRQILDDVIEGLRDTSEFDLDVMIDKDWELAGG